MPDIRCNQFDDNGNSLNRKHAFHKDCRYIHPDNPSWKHARPSHSRRRPSADDRSKPDAWAPDGPAQAAPSRALKAANSTDTERGWGNTSEHRTATRHDPHSDIGRDSAKDASDPSSGDNNQSSDVQPTWSTTESSGSWMDNLEKAAEKGALKSTWGSSSGNDMWGSASGSWGGGDGAGSSLGKEKNTESGGWGKVKETEDSGWGKRKDADGGGWRKGKDAESAGSEKERTADNGGWGAQSNSTNSIIPTAPRAWGEANIRNKATGMDQRNDKEDVTMRDPSPSFRPPSSVSTPTLPSHPFDDRAKKPQSALLRLDLDLGPPRGRTASFSPAPSTSSMSRPTPRPFMTSLAKMPFVEAARLALSTDIAKGKLAETGTPTPTSPQKSYIGYKGRLKLYTEVVEAMQEAILFQVVMQRAQDEAVRWKQAQASETYSHPTFKTRTKLEEHRAQYDYKVSEAKLARDRALKHLAKLPELPTKPYKSTGINLDSEAIRTYTNELKEWLRDLEQHQALLKAKQDEEDAKLKASLVDSLADPRSSPQILELQSLLHREKWSWKDIKSAIDLLEVVLDDASEFVYGETYTRVDELYGELKVLDEKLPPIVVDQETPGEAMQALAPRADTNGQALQIQIDKAAQAFSTIRDLEEKIETLKQERLSMDRISEQAEAEFAAYDKLKESEAAERRDLTELIQNLSLHSRPTPKPVTTLSPVKIEELLEYIRPIVVQHVKGDLEKVLTNLSLCCRENQEQVAKEIDELLKPVIEATEQIRQRTST